QRVHPTTTKTHVRPSLTDDPAGNFATSSATTLFAPPPTSSQPPTPRFPQRQHFPAATLIRTRQHQVHPQLEHPQENPVYTTTQPRLAATSQGHRRRTGISNACHLHAAATKVALGLASCFGPASPKVLVALPGRRARFLTAQSLPHCFSCREYANEEEMGF